MILISECFCSRCGHTNQHPPPTWRETTGHNGRQDHFRAQEDGHTNHPPPPTWRETTGENGRQRETTGDKTTSEPKKPTTPTNTKAARSKVALRTPTVNCLGKNVNHMLEWNIYICKHLCSIYRYMYVFKVSKSNSVFRMQSTTWRQWDSLKYDSIYSIYILCTVSTRKLL